MINSKLLVTDPRNDVSRWFPNKVEKENSINTPGQKHPKHWFDSISWATRWLVALLCLHASMLAYGAWVHGPGWDEGGHLPAGISHWQLGNTDAYRVNPPLIRMVATAPIAWHDFDLRWYWISNDTRTRPEWGLGTQFWRTQGRSAYRYLTLARWFSIPWSLLAAVVVFQWGKRLYGEAAGLFSAGLWCFSPLVLTNAQMMTPDVGAAALGAAASLAFANWLRVDVDSIDGTWWRALDAGVLLGLAELSKFTWVILYVLWPLVLLLYLVWKYLKSQQNKYHWLVSAKRSAQMLIILGIAVTVVNVGYGLEGTLTPLGEYRFVSRPLRGQNIQPEYERVQTLDDANPIEPGNRFAETWLAKIPIPFPKNYVLGIDRQKLDFESDFRSYLRGQWRSRGWWYYYAYGLLVKEPIGYIVMFIAVIGLSLCIRWRWEEAYLLLPAVVIFTLVSSQTGFNHHLRYVLPAFPFVFIWMGKLVLWTSHARWRAWAVASLMGSAAACSLIVFPHSHAYFNAFAGGPLHGHDHLLDSNIDWGQDILVLADWIEKNPDKPIDAIAYSLDWLIDRDALGMTSANPPAGFQGADVDESTQSQFGPRPGRYAVFVRPLREDGRQYDYFLEFTPKIVLGYTVYIYEFTDEDVRRYWENRGS